MLRVRTHNPTKQPKGKYIVAYSPKTWEEFLAVHHHCHERALEAHERGLKRWEERKSPENKE